VKLLIVAPSRSLEAGGSQIACLLAEQLRLRHEVTLWTPPPPERLSPPWLHRRTQSDALLDFVRGRHRFDLIDVEPVLFDPRLRRFSPVMVRTVQPDLLYLGVDARIHRHRLPRVKDAYHLARIAILRRRVRRAYENADRVLTLGRAEANWLAVRFSGICDRLGSYVAAPSTCDQSRFSHIRAERLKRPVAPTSRWLWIGRWAAHKGPHTLSDWARQRLGECRHESLTIAGSGNVDDTTRHMWRSLGERVRWVPSYTRQDLPQLLLDHEWGVFTSEVEGWGLSLNEMLESGLTVYATKAGGVESLRPYFPRQLREFPPVEPLERGIDDPLETRYYETFSWPSIAAAYEQECAITIAAHDVGQ
jgi:glycosyltransferase involved in cell wall biosynthesis